MEILNQISEAFQWRQAPMVNEMGQNALDDGLNAKEILEGGLIDGIGENVTTMMGGAPVTQNFCDTIGVEVYATDAALQAVAS